MENKTCKIQRSLVKLDQWLQSHNYEGYEPYDALKSYLKPLTMGNPLASRILQQVVLRCPFHIRPLLWIKTEESASGMGMLARSYLRMWLLTKNVLSGWSRISHLVIQGTAGGSIMIMYPEGVHSPNLCLMWFQPASLDRLSLTVMKSWATKNTWKSV